MTQPTVVFFGPDGAYFKGNKNKVYLRTLLYSSAKRGHVIESLHVTLKRNESKQNFNIWVYGEKGKLHRGSGLFIPQDGITYDHHFLLPADGANFPFVAGSYQLKVYAKLVREEKFLELGCVSLSISENQAEQLSKSNAGVFFDWGPDSQDYHSHIDSRPNT